jgi:hypothetical protein
MILSAPARSHSGCTMKLARQTETGNLLSSRQTRNVELGTSNRRAPTRGLSFESRRKSAKFDRWFDTVNIPASQLTQDPQNDREAD